MEIIWLKDLYCVYDWRSGIKIEKVSHEESVDVCMYVSKTQQIYIYNTYIWDQIDEDDLGPAPS